MGCWESTVGRAERATQLWRLGQHSFTRGPGGNLKWHQNTSGPTVCIGETHPRCLSLPSTTMSASGLPSRPFGRVFLAAFGGVGGTQRTPGAPICATQPTCKCQPCPWFPAPEPQRGGRDLFLGICLEASAVLANCCLGGRKAVGRRVSSV